MYGHAGRTVASLLVALAACLALPALARADDDDDRQTDVRVVGRCTGTSEISLRIRERDDDELRLELRISAPRRGERWTVVVVHERRLVVRTRTRANRSGDVRLRRDFGDWFGGDAVVVRARAARGETCSASARIDDDD